MKNIFLNLCEALSPKLRERNEQTRKANAFLHNVGFSQGLAQVNTMCKAGAISATSGFTTEDFLGGVLVNRNVWNDSVKVFLPGSDSSKPHMDIEVLCEGTTEEVLEWARSTALKQMQANDVQMVA